MKSNFLKLLFYFHSNWIQFCLHPLRTTIRRLTGSITSTQDVTQTSVSCLICRVRHTDGVNIKSNTKQTATQEHLKRHNGINKVMGTDLWNDIFYTLSLSRQSTWDASPILIFSYPHNKMYVPVICPSILLKKRHISLPHEYFSHVPFLSMLSQVVALTHVILPAATTAVKSYSRSRGSWPEEACEVGTWSTTVTCAYHF